MPSTDRTHDKNARPASGTPAREQAPRPFALPTGASLALILAAALWLHLPALDAPFFADDYLFLDQVRGRSLTEVLAAPDPLSNFYRPVGRQLYFWTLLRAGGDSPLVFHAVNLALFLVVLALLFAVGRRIAGSGAGLLAAALLGLHYSADVPVRWASGGQELLAVAGGLGAILLHVSGRRLWAGAALLLAALSKETVLLAPIIAAAADRRPDEPWRETARRAWPLFSAVGLWGSLWMLMPERRAQQATDLAFDATAPWAALAHLAQVALGFEWRQGEFGYLPRVGPPWIPLALALVAVGWAGVGGASRRGGKHGAASAGEGQAPSRGGAPAAAVKRKGAPPERSRGVGIGALWALLGVAPVAVVASTWSAYYYLFAMCGVALALGAWLARRPRAWALAAMAVLATGSASARSLDEFAVARSGWTGRSHVNRFYIERATRQVARYLESLKRARPTLPSGSTVFFAGLKGNVALQTGDGPLLRLAYRDTSLRSYYLNEFSREKVGRGPMMIFVGSGDTLREMEQGPDLMRRIALSMILSDRFPGARDALMLGRERNPPGETESYWLAWVQWALGDTAGARESLRRAGVSAAPGPAPEVRQALASLDSGDTLAAFQMMRTVVREQGLDPGVHALLADLSLIRDPDDPAGAVEALAARVLVPEQPYGWRRWGMVQAHRGRYLEALDSFERYFTLLGSMADTDTEARDWVARIRSMLPGGDLAPEGLRE